MANSLKSGLSQTPPSSPGGSSSGSSEPAPSYSSSSSTVEAGQPKVQRRRIKHKEKDQRKSLKLREKLVSTREKYSDSIRELRQERIHWRADQKELQHLKKLVKKEQRKGEDNCDLSAADVDLIRKLVEEQAISEEKLDIYADHVKDLKAKIHDLQQENKSLRGEMNVLRNQNKSTRIQDLEEQIYKWEVLYMESAEVGTRKMEKLEQELEDMRESFQTTQHTAEQAQESMSRLKSKLQKARSDQQEKAKLLASHRYEAYKREAELTRKLENTEAEKEILQMVPLAVDEIAMLEHIDTLERELREKELAAERADFERRRQLKAMETMWDDVNCHDAAAAALSGGEESVRTFGVGIANTFQEICDMPYQLLKFTDPREAARFLCADSQKSH